MKVIMSIITKKKSVINKELNGKNLRKLECI